MEGEPVAAAAVAARIVPVRHEPRVRPVTCGLTFDRLEGPVVAICGLAGGVGSSTLAFALARQAASESRMPVLLADAAATPGITHIAGSRSPRSLGTLAAALAAGESPDQACVELRGGLRLIATGPERRAAPSPAAIEELLDHAGEAHGLVVLDCGTSWMSSADVLACASHVVWTMAATGSGLRVARDVFASGLAPTTPHGEVLVARHLLGSPRARVRELRHLARRRRCRLVLMAHDEANTRDGTPGEATLRALTAIAPTFRRGSA